MGPDLGIDVARVAELRPDLVLASLTVPGHERVVERLEAAGLPFLALAPRSLEDVHADIATIAERLAVEERGQELVALMRERIPAATADSASVVAELPRVLVEWWPKPVIVPGRQSWVTDLLARAGGVNPLADVDVESTPIDDERAAALAPDAVVISWCGVDPANYRTREVYKRPGWQQLPALRHGQVHCVPEAWLGRPGPRLVEGYRALAKIVAGCRNKCAARPEDNGVPATMKGMPSDGACR